MTDTHEELEAGGENEMKLEDLQWRSGGEQLGGDRVESPSLHSDGGCGTFCLDV